MNVWLRPKTFPRTRGKCPQGDAAATHLAGVCHRLAQAALLTTLLLTPLAQAIAQSENLTATSTQRLRDAEFGVSTRQLGLQRHVQMYQWRRLADGFESAWISRAVDSSGFPDGFNNPAALPVPVRYWLATDVRINGHPVDTEVLEALGIWRDFRPSFSALPAAASARYQPEGDGLGSAENPQLPLIGDVRISWRELTLPKLEGQIVLVDGRWVLSGGQHVQAVDESSAEPTETVAPPPLPAQQPEPVASAAGLQRYHLVLLSIGMLLALFAVIVIRRRR